jgi:hypothetical protein
MISKPHKNGSFFATQPFEGSKTLNNNSLNSDPYQSSPKTETFVLTL